MNKLEIAKQIIKENFKSAQCGIFDCSNIVGDHMDNIYCKDGLEIDICYYYEYFEVFGLSDEEFKELDQFYWSLEDEIEEGHIMHEED